MAKAHRVGRLSLAIRRAGGAPPGLERSIRQQQEPVRHGDREAKLSAGPCLRTKAGSERHRRQQCERFASVHG